jgi:hypothetical protein
LVVEQEEKGSNAVKLRGRSRGDNKTTSGPTRHPGSRQPGRERDAVLHPGLKPVRGRNRRSLGRLELAAAIEEEICRA